jgi:SNF2 family DNA or RNA helicase
MYSGSESISQKDAAKKAFTEGDSRVMLMSLRSGAGIDGLQKYCRTVVNVELDWSPGVHEQFTGRLLRDGQDDVCYEYWLVSDNGSDPTVASVLGIKKAQVDGIRADSRDLFEKINTDDNHIKTLAKAFLEKKGLCQPTHTQGSDRTSTTHAPNVV